MSSKYEHTNQCHQNTKTKKQVLKNELQVILLLMLLPPPRPLASPPGQDRRNLLPNMANGLKPLLRAHDLLLTHLCISVGKSGTNHVIGIMRASCLVSLPLLCNDLLFICWPRKIFWKRWQNLRVRHRSVP